MFIENEGNGLLFDNSEGKEKNENAPDYTGQINVGGEQYRIALWWKEFEKGDGFSANIQPAEGNYGGEEDDDDDEDEEPQPTRRAKPAGKSAGKASTRKPSRASSAPAPKTSHRKPSRR